MATLFGTLFLNEALGRWQVLGAGLVVLGVILVSIRGKRWNIKHPHHPVGKVTFDQ
jgi:drug/metabolite transporter (DMT)-like permease